jgi:ABC-type branched-subunit amino acid transport system ATPase component
VILLERGQVRLSGTAERLQQDPQVQQAFLGSRGRDARLTEPI